MIHLEDQDGIALLRLAHGKANAIDLELFVELDRHLETLVAGPPLPVILTGSGPIFSAGVDLFRLLQEDAAYLEAFLGQLSTTLKRLFTLPLPVVAAINGHALAGGAILATACDYRVLAAGPAKLGVTEMLVGVPFPTVALEAFRYLLPPREAQQLILSGRTLEGDEALRLGLVDEVVPPAALLDHAVRVARQFGQIPADVFAVTKAQLRAPAVLRMEQGAPATAASIREIWDRPTTRAKIRGFLAQAVGKKHATTAES